MDIQEDELRDLVDSILKFPEQINRSQRQTVFFRCELGLCEARCNVYWKGECGNQNATIHGVAAVRFRTLVRT